MYRTTIVTAIITRNTNAIHRSDILSFMLRIFVYKNRGCVTVRGGDPANKGVIKNGVLEYRVVE